MVKREFVYIACIQKFDIPEGEYNGVWETIEIGGFFFYIDDLVEYALANILSIQSTHPLYNIRIACCTIVADRWINMTINHLRFFDSDDSTKFIYPSDVI